MGKKSITDFMTYIGAAISNCSLYSSEHEAVYQFCRKVWMITEDLFIDDELSISILGGNIIYNDVPFTDRSDHVSRFTKRLRIKGIEKIIIKKGVIFDEIKTFVSALASLDRPVTSSSYITVGMLEVRHKREGGFSAFMEESAARVNEVYEGVSRFNRLDIRGLEDIVGGFITALKKEMNVLNSLSPVKSHSIYTYVHETNVALLTVFQAEALGLQGEALYDIGLAGLLHDIGKMFVPKEILDKKEALSDDEWDTIKLHPVYGTLYLSSLPDVPKAAVVAAFEHHLQYDLSGYPKIKIKARKQHIVSQIVAIADVYDALRTKRPYRGGVESREIFEILKKEAGKSFNHQLVDNFISACEQVKAL